MRVRAYAYVLVGRSVSHICTSVLLLLQIMLIDSGCNVMDAEWSAIIQGVCGGFLPHSAKCYVMFHLDRMQW